MSLSDKSIHKFRGQVLGQVENEYYKIWIEEAIVNNVGNTNLIDWIKNTFNVGIPEGNHTHIQALYKTMKVLDRTKKYRKVKEEIQNEEDVDPRFQKMAQEIDELKEETELLKRMVFELFENKN